MPGNPGGMMLAEVFFRVPAVMKLQIGILQEQVESLGQGRRVAVGESWTTGADRVAQAAFLRADRDATTGDGLKGNEAERLLPA